MRLILIMIKKVKTAYQLYQARGMQAVLDRCEEVLNKYLVRVRKNIIQKKESALEQHMHSLYECESQKANEFISHVPKALDSLEGRDFPIKLVAFYSFQTGIDDYWMQVIKTQPQYLGHYQPRVPGDLGFYSSGAASILKQQIALAKQYGVYAFCFEYDSSFHNGDLELRKFMENKTLDIHFCLYWKSFEEGLICDAEKILEVLKILNDDRYIKVGGKPVLLLSNNKDLKEKINKLKKIVKQINISDLYVILCDSPHSDFVDKYDADAILDVPYNPILVQNNTKQHKVLNKRYQGNIYNYSDIVSRETVQDTDRQMHYKTVIPNWDDSTKFSNQGTSFCNATSDKYAEWLSIACKDALNFSNKDEQMVFIDSWNKWCQSSYLEPDRKNGYAYLHATANVLRNLGHSTFAHNTNINDNFQKSSDIAVILHVYYEDVGLDIVRMIAESKGIKVDIVITVREDCTEYFLKHVKLLSSSVYFIFVKNKGRDILPFMNAYSWISAQNYQYVCKLHTKKSPHREDGEIWRKNLINQLWEHAHSILELYNSDESLGLVAPTGSIANIADDFGPNNEMRNKYWLDIVLMRLGRSDLCKYYEILFIAGSMFWARVSALNGIDILVDESEFELEAGQKDGTLAHTIERIFGLVVEKNGYKQYELNIFDLQNK